VTGLDPKVTAEFYQLLQELNQSGITIIMVSHDMQAAAAYASHILHIEKDTSFYGTKAEYQKSEAWKAFQYTAGGEGHE